MTTKKLISLAMVGLMLTAVIPQPVRAGDEEWATAGKILTGLAVFQVLNNMLRPAQPYYVEEQRTVYVEQPVYMYAPPPAYTPAPVYAPPQGVYAPPAQQEPVYAPQPYSGGAVPPPVPPQETPVVVQQPAPVVVQQQTYVETPTVVYEVRYFEGRRMEGCPRVKFRNRNYQPREIVIPYGEGTRLYQPGIRGHVTYVQQWSGQQGAWVTVGRHPCMW